MSNLATILEHYGFKSQKEQLDLIRLFYLAGCFDPQTLSNDLEEIGHTKLQIETALTVAAEAGVKEAAPKNIKQFNPELILNKLFISAFDTQNPWPEKIHNWLIQITQREFFARNPGQERWQQQTGQWMQTYKEDIRAISERLGLEKEIAPQHKDYVGMAILGATAPEMKKRLEYARKLIEQDNVAVQRLFFLTGERYASKPSDGNEEYLNQVAANNNIEVDKVTETHLMQAAYNQVKGGHSFSQVPVTIIDTPKGNKERPTTIDTLDELAKNNPNLAGDMLFVSRSPNIKSQAEDILSTLQTKLPEIKPEVVGGASEDMPLNRLMGALGGSLYGGYARVAQALGATIPMPILEQKRSEFNYSAQIERSKQAHLSAKPLTM